MLESDVIQPIYEVNHIPVFWGGKVNSMKQIEAAGHEIYYIIGVENVLFEDNHVKKSFPVTRMYRVDVNLIGRAVVPASAVEMELWTEVKQEAYFDLPKIPFSLMKKMDAFFRQVDKLYQSEGIVILTFDRSYLETDNPGDGWGCIVPKQENTSTHCNYTMEEVINEKPEGVDIVGSVHSHPGMAAYFSGTDHKDQADFEGIHITYGWKHGKPDTEYHIEMTLGGRTWPYEPKQVFDMPPEPSVDTTEVQDWIEGKVSKKSYTGNSSTTLVSGSGNQFSYSHSSNVHQPGLPAGTYSNLNNISKPKRAIHLPEGAPNPMTTMVIASTSREDSHGMCPFCAIPLSESNWESGRCMACWSFIIPVDFPVRELQDARIARGNEYILTLDLDKSNLPIHLWIPKGTSGSDKHFFSQDLRTNQNATSNDGAVKELQSPK